jgi:integrase
MSKRGQGDGTIRQRKDGSWEARFTLGKDSAGKQKQKSIYGKTEKEVKDKLKLIMAELVKNTYIEECSIPFYSWLETWLKTYKKNTIRKSTYETHENAIRRHIKDSDIGSTTLSKLKPYHLQKLYNEKLDTLSPATVKRLHVILKDALKQAYKCDMITSNPADKVKPPAMEKADIKIMTVDQQKHFIQALETETLRVAFLLAMQTGLRLGELLALRWEDIDIENRKINVKSTVRRIYGKLELQQPKTKNSVRSVPLMGIMIKEIERYNIEWKIRKMANKKEWGNKNYIFCTASGNLLEPRNFTRVFKRILRNAELPDFNFHALRHTFVSRLLEAGEDAKTIADIIGHKKSSFTLDTYAHILPEKKQLAVEKIASIFIL